MDHLHKRYPENKNKCHCADRRSWRHSGSLPLCMVQHCGKLGSLWEYRESEGRRGKRRRRLYRKPDPAPAESWRSGIVCSSGEYTAQLGIYNQK